jgi:hypothetical protein
VLIKNTMPWPLAVLPTLIPVFKLGPCTRYVLVS